jgi:hypothetical protein
MLSREANRGVFKRRSSLKTPQKNSSSSKKTDALPLMAAGADAKNAL